MTTFVSTFVAGTALIELDPTTGFTPTGKVRIAYANTIQAFTFTASNIKPGIVVAPNTLSSSYGKPVLALPVAVAVSAGTSGFEGGAVLTSPVTVKFVDLQGNVVKADWS